MIVGIKQPQYGVQIFRGAGARQKALDAGIRFGSTLSGNSGNRESKSLLSGESGDGNDVSGSGNASNGKSGGISNNNGEKGGANGDSNSHLPTYVPSPPTTTPSPPT